MSDRALEFLICDCSLKWRKLYEKFTSDLGIIGLERRVILTLFDNPEITQVTLADFLEQEPQSLTRILDRLEDKKLILKNTAKNDRRAKCLTLTEDGLKLHNEIMKIADKLRPDILAEVSESDLDVLEKVLGRIKINLCKKLV